MSLQSPGKPWSARHTRRHFTTFSATDASSTGFVGGTQFSLYSARYLVDTRKGGYVMNNEHSLNGKRVAMLVTTGFEEVELTNPQKALQGAGAETVLVSPQADKVRSWNSKNWGSDFTVDQQVSSADAGSFDALLLPGGVMNPDKLRMDEDAVAFVRSFFEQGKPVAAICHGPWVLAEADVINGRKLTSYPSLKTDLRNAGANWVDEEVVVDAGLVTSRNPDDLPAFNRKMLEEFAEGRHDGQRA